MSRINDNIDSSIGSSKKHSFIVLAYKNSPYLEDCIFSLKNQTVKSEIYLATSTPSDFLVRVSEKNDIRILINRNCKSIAEDWSYAYNQCRTEYLTLAHQDDIYMPKYTETCLTAAQKDRSGNNLIVFTGYNEIVDTQVRSPGLHLFIKKILLVPFLFKHSIGSVFLKRLMLSFGNSISCPTVMYHKSKLGEFEFFKDFCCNIDWDAWLRLSVLKGNFIYVNDNLVLHRINDDSQTSLQIKKNVRHMEDRIIFERLWPRPIAAFLSRIYSLATKFNQTE